MTIFTSYDKKVIAPVWIATICIFELRREYIPGISLTCIYGYIDEKGSLHSRRPSKVRRRGVYSALVGTAPISFVATSCATYVFIYVCKCQVNADASLDVHRLWEYTAMPSSGPRAEKIY